MNISSEEMFRLARKARLERRLRTPPCDIWSCEIRPRRIYLSRKEEQSQHWSRFAERGYAALWCLARIEGPREGGNSPIFFFPRHTRACVGDRQRARDLCTRMKSRVATSGKRNWSRYAPCEKATEINGHARESEKPPVGFEKREMSFLVY